MTVLKFLVQGSAQQPYVVRFDTIAGEVKAFCSCPSGRNAGRLCKHVKMAIEGGSQVLREGSDDREDLLRLVAGTPLEWKAENYVPPERRARIEGCSTVAEMHETYRAALEARGFVVEYAKVEGDFASERLSLFERFKNGKVRKGASIVISWDRLAYDIGMLDDGTEVAINVRPRERPFGVSGKIKVGQWADPGAALHAFLLNAGLVVS